MKKEYEGLIIMLGILIIISSFFAGIFFMTTYEEDASYHGAEKISDEVMRRLESDFMECPIIFDIPGGDPSRLSTPGLQYLHYNLPQGVCLLVDLYQGNSTIFGGSPNSLMGVVSFKGKSTIEIYRYSKDDYMVVHSSYINETVKLGCDRHFYYNPEIDRDKIPITTYICIFKGEVRGRNLRYEQLKDYTCEGIEVECKVWI